MFLANHPTECDGYYEDAEVIFPRSLLFLASRGAKSGAPKRKRLLWVESRRAFVVYRSRKERLVEVGQVDEFGVGTLSFGLIEAEVEEEQIHASAAAIEEISRPITGNAAAQEIEHD